MLGRESKISRKNKKRLGQLNNVFNLASNEFPSQRLTGGPKQ
tara:strand:+ start:672 stop:797 length:126 start_codon:yes stop_codon:yes gene_type:complete